MRWLTLLVLASGCLRSTAYHCETSAQCGAGGTCQSSVGFCSFADPECGQRFGPQAGQYAGTCVTPDQGIDAAIDDTLVGDGPPGNHCPAGYNTIPNGTAGHRYKLAPTSDTWLQQATACNGQFTYLTIPNDVTELGALDTFIGLEPMYWVGIDDMATSGVWQTVQNLPAPYLPWQAPAPDLSPPPKQCVQVITSVAMITNDKCANTQLPAVCECE